MAHYITDANKNVIKVAGNHKSNDATILAQITPLKKRYLVDSYINETTGDWYNIYSDGWKECGGIIPSGASEVGKIMTLPITFSNAKYNIWYCNFDGFLTSTVPYCDIAICPVTASTFKCTRFASYARTYQANGY